MQWTQRAGPAAVGDERGCVMTAWTYMPETPAKADPAYVEHVHKDGARYHVLSWMLIRGRAVTRCSEPRCIINKEAEDTPAP